ncbi:DUF72 domain-containing protein [Aureimonas fodinaquatilis]|uniref:DUF72 domain-containing protein n=1 Tax=Aureimonas fodinaquatilis TaxID=2565783 RepID=A0A5B0DXT9_9HYPH|nr:DUF72 domain-containing protein [Aureimonas fodinaquatilis]KAA0971168.1 DUF72 domain-containing protein [Aureimonas fodinaquatilis]
MVKTPGKIYVGVGGWVFEPWRVSFYEEGLPQKRELEFASQRLTSIEINGTYYGSQKRGSFERWYQETPAGFVFSLKAPRFATNRRQLAEAGASIEKFFASGVTALGEKLGAINWQFQATKSFDPEDFAAFLDLFPKEVDGLKIRHALEVRHESFSQPDFIALAGKHKVAVIRAVDSRYVEIETPTAPFRYLRIMGSQEDEAAGYSPQKLDDWAKQARNLAKDGTDVFLYFISGAKVRNPHAAMGLIERLHKD